MKNLFIIIILLLICLFNVEAREQDKKKTEAPKLCQQKTVTNNVSSELYFDLQKECEDLQGQIDAYKKKAAAYVEPLIECCNDKTPLDKFDIDNANNAIKTYEDGKTVVDFFNPHPEFDGTTEINALKKKIEKAKTVQNAYAMLKRKYSSKEIEAVKINLLSKDPSLTEVDSVLCENMADTLANDMELRGEFASFLRTQFCEETPHLPRQEEATEAYSFLINEFVNQKYPGKKNVPETYALVHGIIADMTEKLANYNGSLSSKQAFQAWVNNFVKQLSTE